MSYAIRPARNIAPCPFCGVKPTLYYYKNFGKYGYCCDNEDCPTQPTTAWYQFKGSATKAWNRCKKYLKIK